MAGCAGAGGAGRGTYVKTDGQLLLQMCDCCYRKQYFLAGERPQSSGCVAEAEERKEDGVKTNKYMSEWRLCWIKVFLRFAGVEARAEGCDVGSVFSQHGALFV